MTEDAEQAHTDDAQTRSALGSKRTSRRAKSGAPGRIRTVDPSFTKAVTLTRRAQSLATEAHDQSVLAPMLAPESAKGREIASKQLAADLLRAAESAADPVPLIRAARALLEGRQSGSAENRVG